MLQIMLGIGISNLGQMDFGNMDIGTYNYELQCISLWARLGTSAIMIYCVLVAISISRIERVPTMNRSSAREQKRNSASI